MSGKLVFEAVANSLSICETFSGSTPMLSLTGTSG